MDAFLHVFVDDPLHGRFHDAQVGSPQALVQRSHAFVLDDAGEAMPGRVVQHVAAGLQLHARLYEPDGVGEGGGGDTGQSGGAQMHIGRIFVAVVELAQDVLALGVGRKVDGTGGHHPHDRRPNALPQGGDALIHGHLPHYLHRPGHVPDGTPQDPQRITAVPDDHASRAYRIGGGGGDELLGLQTGLDDFQGAGDDGADGTGNATGHKGYPEGDLGFNLGHDNGCAGYS